MQVTTEDGGRLNAFAKEPRMEVMTLASLRNYLSATLPIHWLSACCNCVNDA